MTPQHREGQAAHDEGKDRRGNPYDVNSNEWMDWMDGFDQAATEAELKRNSKIVDTAAESVETLTVYRSSNGDDWMVERSQSGAITAVLHRANLSSGGTQTRMTVEEFFERGSSGPEMAAVRSAIEG
ncbi:hypothetical protein [Aureimonas sp. AU20]|uniref:hypothetical protein n=1 Tax=Aureimonas sp. AU20 TaxID=1349819 RepID=UPI000722946B|nr:hypothetical protein [Aureimonas sp. AU20]ALN75716.1 hypothetical protein M673_23500 [Aureimonas sp. AU20]